MAKFIGTHAELVAIIGDTSANEMWENGEIECADEIDLDTIISCELPE